MYIIAGLGNPKAEYKNTRHNIGFDVIEALADKMNIPMGIEKHKAIIGKGYIEGQKAVLVMPMTYMNLSGDSLIEVCNYYKIDIETELIVVYDDIDLEVGGMRIRKSGSAGGHNGMKSIINRLGTQNFTRIRMGVGEKPKGYDLADYVLGHFSKEERVLMDEDIDRAIEAVRVIVTKGADQAMNQFNVKSTKKSSGN